MKIFLLTILLTSLFFVSLNAQEMPLVYDVENTGADCPIPYLPSFNELTVIENLPDPFEWSDGRGRLANFMDWRYRRAEIKAEIEYYEIGVKPDRPDSITANYNNDILTVNITVNGNTLTLTSQIVLPAGSGPFPAVIGMNSANGSIPSGIFSSRNIATIRFNANQVTTYGSQQNSDPYYQLYTNLNVDNTGQYSAWAWGVSRIIDGLELVQDVLPIDLNHLAVTGCSYAGKMALFAGAFDERIALTIAQESGGGGATSWRYSHSEPNGSVEKIDNTDYKWFKESMKQFSGDNVARLPEDHHELMAMVAPRALFVTANPDYIWLSNPSSYVCSKACQPVYDALGISERFGFGIVGDHGHCQIPDSQTPEIEAFVDKFLLGIDSVSTNISTSPYNINLNPWITWTTPELSSGSSFFGKASLIYPADLGEDLDTSITFVWQNVQDADEYFFQLSNEPTFKTFIESDTLTDTVKTVNGLLKGKKYFWRIQVKNIEGKFGPWSGPSVFITYIPLPAQPQLISAMPHPDRYFSFNWRKVELADLYRIQVSRLLTFSPLAVPTRTTIDTVINLSVSGLTEGLKYYWKIQADNLGGSGPWSDPQNFIMIIAPTDLQLSQSALNEITLSWKDNSGVENGYVIERKQDTDTNFLVLDTLKGSGTEYKDQQVYASQTYTYRIKAFKDSTESGYSNEASLLVSGIDDERKIPTAYALCQNYPNPFNPSTKIEFALPKSTTTKIVIYDLLGREIQILINKFLEAGYHEINFSARNFQSGIYFYRIQSGDFVQARKMILLK